MFLLLWQTGSDVMYLQYELLQLRLLVFNSLQTSLPLGLQKSKQVHTHSQKQDMTESLLLTDWPPGPDTLVLSWWGIRSIWSPSCLWRWCSWPSGHSEHHRHVSGCSSDRTHAGGQTWVSEWVSDGSQSDMKWVWQQQLNWPRRSGTCCLQSWTRPPARLPPHCRTSPLSSAPSHTLSWKNAANPSRFYRPSCCACQRNYSIILNVVKEENKGDLQAMNRVWNKTLNGVGAFFKMSIISPKGSSVFAFTIYRIRCWFIFILLERHFNLRVYKSRCYNVIILLFVNKQRFKFFS